MLHDVVIHENEATRIGQVLGSFLEESGVSEALLIDRSGQLLASTGKTPANYPIGISVGHKGQDFLHRCRKGISKEKKD